MHWGTMTEQVKQKQSSSIRYKYRQTIREKQIERIKQNIRKLYSAHQKQYSNKQWSAQDNNRLGIQQFRNRLKFNRISSSCQICQLEILTIQCQYAQYIRHDKQLCISHQKKVIDTVVGLITQWPIEIIKLYNNYQIQKQNMMQVKRTLSLVCQILLSNQLERIREILSNFCIKKLIVEGWYEYWVEQYMQSSPDYSRSQVSRVRYLVMECSRLIILHRLLDVGEDTTWKFIRLFITSHDIFNRMIGYDWLIWVLNAKHYFKVEQISSMEPILLNGVYKKNIISDMQCSSQILQLQIQICHRCLLIRLGDQNRNRDGERQYMQGIRNWIQLIQKQVDGSKNIIKFSQQTLEWVCDIQQLLQDYICCHVEVQCIEEQDNGKMDIEIP